MPDKLEGLPPVPEPSVSAPFIYFDVVPTFGVSNGVVGLTLEALRFLVESPGRVSTARVPVAHVRTSIEGLRQLKTAIEEIERTIQTLPPGPQAQMRPPPPPKAKPN